MSVSIDKIVAAVHAFRELTPLFLELALPLLGLVRLWPLLRLAQHFVEFHEPIAPVALGFLLIRELSSHVRTIEITAFSVSGDRPLELFLRHPGAAKTVVGVLEFDVDVDRGLERAARVRPSLDTHQFPAAEIVRPSPGSFEPFLCGGANRGRCSQKHDTPRAHDPSDLEMC